MADLDPETLTAPDQTAQTGQDFVNDAGTVDDTGAPKADMAAVFAAPDFVNPFAQWLAAAEAHEVNDPNAMTLATVRDGAPDARVVLLKGFDARGFVFYTNLESAKGRALGATPDAALCFHWKSLRRQVRVRGRVETVSVAEADAYYASRARGSRIGAWASPQSRVIESREALEALVAEAEARFAEQDPPRPPHWSGLRVVPREVEFWQDGAFRLHDRCLFQRDGAGWRTVRLAP